MPEVFDYHITKANRRLFANLVDEILEDLLNHDIQTSGEPTFDGNKLVLRIENWDLHHDLQFHEVDGMAMETESPFWVYSYYEVFCEKDELVVVKKTAREDNHVIINEEVKDLNREISEEDQSRLLKAYTELVEKK